MTLTSLIEIFVERNNLAGLNPSDWIGEEIPMLPMLIATLVAGWAKPRWLQWARGSFFFSL